ncbi:BrnT family toxin [Crenothrix sp.]|uniref:BrnT family toxin n=1 Tax=Crenothrix sp. TaxID=3100433 RepID=UPI00374D91BB
MEIKFDTVKNEKNIQERNLSFERVAEFDFETAQFDIDTRYNYGETRYRAIGFLDKRLYSLVFVEIVGGIRVISFRKANKREVKRYENQSRSD